VKKKKLKGVIRLRDLVFADPNQTIGSIAKPALTVSPETKLDDLEQFFGGSESCAGVQCWRP
jgi:Mg/Co/Ni transporter MgtE